MNFILTMLSGEVSLFFKLIYNVHENITFSFILVFCPSYVLEGVPVHVFSSGI
jgi:hypothetical protein